MSSTSFQVHLHTGLFLLTADCPSPFLSHFPKPMTPNNKLLPTTNVWAQCRHNQGKSGRSLCASKSFLLSCSSGFAQGRDNMQQVCSKPNSHKTIYSYTNISLAWFYKKKKKYKYFTRFQAAAACCDNNSPGVLLVGRDPFWKGISLTQTQLDLSSSCWMASLHSSIPTTFPF